MYQGPYVIYLSIYNFLGGETKRGNNEKGVSFFNSVKERSSHFPC